MFKESASLKQIRQFKRFSEITAPDQGFQNWIQQPWSSLVLEVGCGTGLHPIQWAQSNTNKGIIAIERTMNKFKGFRGRLKNHNLTNVYSVNADAENWVPANIKVNCLDKIFFLYPNPYPKERQANKRWHRNPFFQYLLCCLKTDGQVCLATNESFYIEEAKLYMQEHWKLELIKEVKLNSLESFKPRTHFEKKYILRDQNCTQLIFKKNCIYHHNWHT